MTTSISGRTVSETSLSGDIGRYLRYQLRGRRGLIVASVGLALPALWFGWPWLVMAGIAPLIIAFAPCAIMCALGVCMMGKSCKKSEAGSAASPATDAAFVQAPDAPKLLTSTSSDAAVIHSDGLVEAKAPARR